MHRDVTSQTRISTTVKNNVIKLTILAFGFLSLAIRADLNLLQPLNFGTVAVVNNATTQSITIDELGNYSISSGLRTLEPGEPAIFEASGFPGNLQLFISSLITQANTNSVIYSPEQFTLTQLHTQSSVITGGDGTAEIIVGGTMVTSGSGTLNFVDTTYTSDLRITINY